MQPLGAVPVSGTSSRVLAASNDGIEGCITGDILRWRNRPFVLTGRCWAYRAGEHPNALLACQHGQAFERGKEMRSYRLIATVFATAAVLAPFASRAVAEGSPATAAAWQALTRIDVQAAYRLLEDNHPGALPQTGDAVFRAALKSARALALKRATEVRGYPGYLATLASFADSMGDGHIHSEPLYRPTMLKWVGLIAARRGNEWVVAKEDRKLVGADLAGARILACGGLPVTRWAKEVLTFHTVASVAALQILNGRWLLLDDGNPFVKWPKRCTFATKHGGSQTLTLHWQRVSASTLRRDYYVPTHGAAGFSFARWRKGYWIGMEQLWYKAGPVIEAAKAHEAALRDAPYLVVDLRGNGGGDDTYGRRLADVIYGAAYVSAVLGAQNSASGCAETYRASPGNIKGTEHYLKLFLRMGDTAGARDWRIAIRDMKTAQAEGKALTGPPSCKDHVVKTAVVRSRMKGQVIVLTDASCFSSCEDTVQAFLKLGATQVGVETGADTHYSEDREVILPSGLSTFTTQEAILTDMPMRQGPFVPKPRFTFHGNMAATPAVKAWVAASVLPALTHLAGPPEI